MLNVEKKPILSKPFKDFLRLYPKKELWRLFVDGVKQKKDGLTGYEEREQYSLCRGLMTFSFALTSNINDYRVTPELFKAINRYSTDGIGSGAKLFTPGQHKKDENSFGIFLKELTEQEREEYDAWIEKNKEKGVQYFKNPLGDHKQLGCDSTQSQNISEEICKNYNDRILLCKTDDEKLDCIVELLIDLERFHLFPDGNCRTVYFLLNRLLIQNGFIPTILDDPNRFDIHSKAVLIEDIKKGIKRTNNIIEHEKNNTKNDYELFDITTTKALKDADEQFLPYVLLAEILADNILQFNLKSEEIQNLEIEEMKLNNVLEFIKTNHDKYILTKLSFANDLISEALRLGIDNKISTKYIEAAIRLILIENSFLNNQMEKLIQVVTEYLKITNGQAYYEVTAQWMNPLNELWNKYLSEQYANMNFGAAADLISAFRIQNHKIQFYEEFTQQVSSVTKKLLSDGDITSATKLIYFAQDRLPKDNYLKLEEYYVNLLLYHSFQLKQHNDNEAKQCFEHAISFLYKADISKDEIELLFQSFKKVKYDNANASENWLTPLFEAHANVIVDRLLYEKIKDEELKKWINMSTSTNINKNIQHILSKLLYEKINDLLKQSKITEAWQLFTKAKSIIDQNLINAIFLPTHNIGRENILLLAKYKETKMLENILASFDQPTQIEILVTLLNNQENALVTTLIKDSSAIKDPKNFLQILMGHLLKSLADKVMFNKNIEANKIVDSLLFILNNAYNEKLLNKNLFEKAKSYYWLFDAVNNNNLNGIFKKIWPLIPDENQLDILSLCPTITLLNNILNSKNEDIKMLLSKEIRDNVSQKQNCLFKIQSEIKKLNTPSFLSFFHRTETNTIQIKILKELEQLVENNLYLPKVKLDEVINSFSNEISKHQFKENENKTNAELLKSCGYPSFLQLQEKPTSKIITKGK